MAGKNRALCGWRAGAARRAGHRRPSARLQRLFFGCVGTTGAEESYSRGRQTLHRSAGTLCQRAKTDASGKEPRGSVEAMVEMERDSGVNVAIGCSYIFLALAPLGILRIGGPTD